MPLFIQLVILLVTSYLMLQFEWSLLVSEINKRPYISVGFIALIILSVLAIASFNVLPGV